jgi:hypothetical protein
MADNLYAGASIQVYPGGEAALSSPHSDVGGFLAYVSQFNGINFHAKDDDVREWRWNAEYDNWQDRLGIDSVKVFYHHGHMGMASDGTWVAGMGRTWDNTLQANSKRMSFGDNRLRYLLLHGCDSLQMHFGQNPFRSWAASNKGARMIFGFDGLTYDVDGTGAGFFREWNTGKSFSQSWQDAAFATTRDHRPASVACGATAEEAQDRLWNERLFDGRAVSDNWYWWRWAGPAPIEVDLTIIVPRVPLHLMLARRPADSGSAVRLAERFDVRPYLWEPASPESASDMKLPSGRRLVLLPDGSYQVFLAEPDRTARPLELEEMRQYADRALRELGLEIELAFDGVTATQHGGVSSSGEQSETTIGDFTAHYRQMHDGMPMVRGGDGHIAVTLDAAGTLCAFSDRSVTITDADEAGPNGSDVDVDGLLADATDAVCRSMGASEVIVVPNSLDIGYRVSGDSAVTVARQDVEITTGDYAIRKVVEVVL